MALRIYDKKNNRWLSPMGIFFDSENRVYRVSAHEEYCDPISDGYWTFEKDDLVNIEFHGEISASNNPNIDSAAPVPDIDYNIYNAQSFSPMQGDIPGCQDESSVFDYSGIYGVFSLSSRCYNSQGKQAKVQAGMLLYHYSSNNWFAILKVDTSCDFANIVYVKPIIDNWKNPIPKEDVFLLQNAKY